MKKIYITLLIAISVALVSSGLSAQTPLGEEFSYQGELKDANGNPHDGVFDFKFVAFDAKDDGMGNNLGQFVSEDVTVTNGIFTTQIDYSLLGDQPFVGNKVWLEISVRIGTTTGGYQQLLPRQQVTATPYANYATIAEMVGSNAVGTNEIIDDSIGATDIGINAVGTSEIDSTQVQRRVSTTCPAGQFIQSVNQDGTAVCVAETIGLTTVTSADIADGTIAAVDIGANAIGTSEINASQVQRRVSTTCPAGQFIQSVNQDGTAVCVAETAGITSVTSSEIVDGTIVAIDIDKTQVQKRIGTVCSGGRLMRSIDVDGVATCIFSNTGADTVVSADIVDGTIVAADVDTSQIQQRIGGSCDDGQYLNGINQDGSIQCKKLPIGLPFTLDNSANVEGLYTSIAIGADNNPIISYYDQTNEDLKVYKCSNSSCSAGTAYTLDGSAFLANTSVGEYTSIAIGADGNPIISYYDQTNEDLKVYKCSNNSCSAGTAYTLDGNALFNPTSVGLLTSIAIGADGNPIISYYDSGNDDLKVVKCSNPSCSTFNTPITLDSTGIGGGYTSIAIGNDDNPIISYSDSGNDDLKVVKCGTTSCSGVNILTTIGSTGIGGGYTSIAIGNDDNPIISYLVNGVIGVLIVVKCGDQSCSTFNPPVTLDSTGDVGLHTSIAISTDGNPIISYYNFKNDDLKVVKCSNPGCSTFNTPTTLDSEGDVGAHTSIAIGADGNPIISYFDFSNGDLKVYSCGDANCSN